MDGEVMQSDSFQDPVGLPSIYPGKAIVEQAAVQHR